MNIFKKIPKEIYIYILWGILVGIVNIGSSYFFMYKCEINELYANFMSWILYNYVSFVTNRKTVFHTHTQNIKEYVIQLIQFYISRVITLLIETGLIFLFVTILDLPKMGVKVCTSILVIFLNYFISKKFIF
ncbi:MAG: GtrA family protein [Coprococcus sp.]|nr:GtrA family protein [Coprococcus sp.]